MTQSYKSYAKLNLNLYVGPPGNGGLHSLLSVFQTIDLHDVITMSKSTGHRHTVHFDGLDVPENNTCVAVLGALSGQLSQWWNVTIKKNIPAGAGLGGGSSNAATLLMVLNQLESLNLSIPDMEAIAQEIGSDVPYFLHGGQAKVSGTGQIIHSNATLIQCHYFVLILPNIHCSTAGVYGVLDARGDFDDLDEVTDDDLKKMGHNRLLHSAMSVAPGLGELYGCVSDVLPADVYMSGSGSTLFVPCHDETVQQRIYAQLLGALPDFHGTLVCSNALNH